MQLAAGLPHLRGERVGQSLRTALREAPPRNVTEHGERESKPRARAPLERQDRVRRAARKYSAGVVGRERRARERTRVGERGAGRAGEPKRGPELPERRRK